MRTGLTRLAAAAGLLALLLVVSEGCSGQARGARRRSAPPPAETFEDGDVEPDIEVPVIEEEIEDAPAVEEEPGPPVVEEPGEEVPEPPVVEEPAEDVPEIERDTREPDGEWE